MGRKRPSVIQVAGGVKFHAAVLHVIEKHPDGTPKIVEVMKDDDSIHLEGGEEFWVVYGPQRMITRRS